MLLRTPGSRRMSVRSVTMVLALASQRTLRVRGSNPVRHTVWDRPPIRVVGPFYLRPSCPRTKLDMLTVNRPWSAVELRAPRNPAIPQPVRGESRLRSRRPAVLRGNEEIGRESRRMAGRPDGVFQQTRRVFAGVAGPTDKLPQRRRPVGFVLIGGGDHITLS